MCVICMLATYGPVKQVYNFNFQTSVCHQTIDSIRLCGNGSFTDFTIRSTCKPPSLWGTPTQYLLDRTACSQRCS